MSAAHICLFAAIISYAGTIGAGSSPAAAVIACFAFTPQFFHALSARNFGLSSRGVGLVLLTGMLFCAFQAQNRPAVEWYVSGMLLAYLIWGFSTFGAQAMIILASLHALLFGRLEIIEDTAGGLAIFVLVHPRYSIGYLRYTAQFIFKYATELAPLYILSRRYSLWRDLVIDIWRQIARDRLKGLRYAYENGVVITLLLNPLLGAAVLWRLTATKPETSIAWFAGEVAICGAAAMVLTSFRATRFLGEPERYIEAVTPWSTMAGAIALSDFVGNAVLVVAAVAFFALDLAQLGMTHFLFRHLTSKQSDIQGAEQAIGRFATEKVRLASNNEHLTKKFMYNDWYFAYFIAAGVDYCGMSITEAFSRFPILRPEALERVVERCRVNICVMDREAGEDLFFTRPSALRSIATLYETPAMRVFGLSWDDEQPPAPTEASA